MRPAPRLSGSFLLALLAAVPGEAARGGPDAGNWSWADSKEPGVDTSVETMITSNTITPAWGDEAIYTVNLSFPFTLYGTTSSTVWLSTNGWLSLVNPGGITAPIGAPIPQAGTPDALLAFYWADLDGGASSFAFEGPTANGHQIVLRANEKATGAMVQFVIQFYTDGSIKVVNILVPAVPNASVGIENGTGTAGSRLQFGTTATGTFNMDGVAILYYPSSSLNCGTASPLGCPGSVNGSTLGGSSAASVWNCSPSSYTGREQLFSFSSAGLSSFTASLTGLGGRDQDLFLLRQGCDSRLDCMALGADTISLPLLAAGNYVLAVDGKTPADDGPFTLTTTCGSAAQPIACNSSVTGNATGASGIDLYGCTGNNDYGGPERIYDFTTTSPQTIIATLSPGAPFDVFLVPSASLRPGTSPCQLNADFTFGQLNLPAGDWTLVVDGPTGSAGAFQLDLSCTPGVPSVPIDCGQSDVAGTLGPDLIGTYGCFGGGYTEGEAFYRFVATSPVNVTATLTDAGSYDLIVFREADVPNSCLAGDAAFISMFNVPPDNYIFALDSSAPAVTPPRLSLSCTPSVYPPLLCGGTVNGVTGNASQLALYPCLTGLFDGGEAIYLLDNPFVQDIAVALSGVPAGTNLDVALLDAGVPFLSSNPPCRQGGDVIARFNAAPVGQYLVVVDGDNAAMNAPFTLSAACFTSVVSCGGVPDLACNSSVAGDTSSGVRNAFLYGQDTELYNGPELIWRFVNPVRQQVGFQLRNLSDARLDLILLDACDTTAIVARGDSEIVVPALDAGSYWLVVDGRESTSGTFDLVTYCGGPRLEPPVLVQTIAAGSCYTETKTLYFPPFVADADLMLSLDLSDSMSDELGQLKPGLRDTVTALAQQVGTLAVGISSFVEYERCYTDTVCGQSSCPTSSGAYAFRVDQPLTTDLAQVDTVLQGLSTVGGGKETYTRSLHEASTSPEIVWRSCARRMWLSAGDEAPVDCNIDACSGGSRNTGRDPGPDLTTGTADDIELLPAVDAMAGNGIALLPLDSSESRSQQAMWSCLAQRTQGNASFSDRFGVPLPGSDLLAGLVEALIDGTRVCPDLRLAPTGPQAAWVAITPASVAPATTPWYGQFDVTFCVPAGNQVAGSYSIPIEAQCPGRGACAPAVIATQAVTINVPPACASAPVAVAGPDATVCEMDALTLDGSRSGTSVCPAGFLYEWRDGLTVVRAAAPQPTWNPPTTPPGSTVYTLVVSCAGIPGCESSDDVVVAVRDCTIAVHFGDYGATAVGATVEIAWHTLSESGTLGFAVQRAARAEGPFATIGTIEARGALADYVVIDPAPDAARPWYRIVEQVSSGNGDFTSAFRAERRSPGAARSRGRARAARRGASDR